VSSPSQFEPLFLDARRPIPATWALAALLVVVHVASAAVWASSKGRGILSPLFLDRSVAFRVGVGGQHADALSDGEYWRLATSVLLHGDGLHLALNTLATLAVGRLLEPAIGPARLLGWFVVGGWVASVGSWTFGVRQSDGASGALFAWLAAACWLGWRHRDRWPEEDRPIVGKMLLGFFAANYLLGWVIPGVDAVAHTVGALVGIGLAAVDPVVASPTRRTLYLALIGAFGATCAYGWFTLA
jgi:rhomboid protease GluP